MKKAELVFIPFPLVGHIVSSVEMAKLLVAQDHRISISILMLKIPGFEPLNMTYIQSLLGSISAHRIKFVQLSEVHHKLDPNINFMAHPIKFFTSSFENVKPIVRKAVKNIIDSFSAQPDSPTLAGFVVDMFSTATIDVADELGVPSYVFYTSSSGCLRLMDHLETLSSGQNKDIAEYKDEPDAEFVVSGFVNPVPARVLPDVVLNKVDSPLYLGYCRDIRRAKGILVNTFMELESAVIDSLTTENLIPPIYPVGPIINHNASRGQKETEIVAWLDSQAPSSVAFLCFGSIGSFNREQVKEIAMALEMSGVRFLWSLRKQGQSTESKDYEDLNEALPEGFLDRTAEIGKVIGWAPQVTVLAHSSVGGFVSHCGWNSTLESLWFGVPMATWPLYAEQQINAFKLVKEYRLAVEIKLDYRLSSNEIVKAEEIEAGIRKLMNPDNDLRKRVKEISEKGKEALMEGGSSHSSLCRFVNDVIVNMPL